MGDSFKGRYSSTIHIENCQLCINRETLRQQTAVVVDALPRHLHPNEVLFTHPSKRGFRQAPSPALHLELQMSQLGVVHPQRPRRGDGRDRGPCARPRLHPAPERRRGRAAVGRGGDGVAWRLVRRHSVVGTTAAACGGGGGSRSPLGCAGKGTVVAAVPVPGWYGRGHLVLL